MSNRAMRRQENRDICKKIKSMNDKQILQLLSRVESQGFNEAVDILVMSLHSSKGIGPKIASKIIQEFNRINELVMTGKMQVMHQEEIATSKNNIK